MAPKACGGLHRVVTGIWTKRNHSTIIGNVARAPKPPPKLLAIDDSGTHQPNGA